MRECDEIKPYPRDGPFFKPLEKIARLPSTAEHTEYDKTHALQCVSVGAQQVHNRYTAFVGFRTAIPEYCEYS